jgi:hypothetical protein
MKQFEDDLVDAFRLIPTLGMVHLADQLFRTHYKDKLNFGFIGIMPSEDTPAEREATKHMLWPPNEILHIIQQTGAKTMGEFLDRIAPTMEKHLDRQVFVLLTTALDSFLERNGFHGTLGRRFSDVKGARSIPANVDCDMQEVIQRRNDIAHGGVVTADYISGAKYPGLLSSSWVTTHGVPPTTGVSHRFDLEYLYWATTTMYRLAHLR